jgi:hypothetical protein
MIDSNIINLEKFNRTNDFISISLLYKYLKIILVSKEKIGSEIFNVCSSDQNFHNF